MAHDYQRQPNPDARWTEVAAGLVKAGYQRAGLGEYKRHCTHWRALHAFSTGEHRELLEQRLALLYPDSAAAELNENEKGHAYFPLVQMYQDRLAVVFDQPPETFLHRGDGIPLPEDDPQARQWRLDEKSVRLPTTLQTAERWMVGMNQAFIHVGWLRNEIRWWVHAPYELRVDQDRACPEELEQAQQITARLRAPEDSEDVTSVGNDLLETWSLIDGAWEYWLHDESGALYESTLFGGRNANPYRLHPFAVWRTAQPAPGEFWLPPNIGWYHQQLHADVTLGDLLLHMRMQIHSQAVERGGDDIERRAVGPTTVLKSNDENFQFEYVTPDPNLDLLVDGFNFLLRSSAVAESLPPDTWEPNSSTRNLAAKQLEQAALKARRKRVIPWLLESLARTWTVHKRVANTFSSGRTTYDPDVQLGVHVAPMEQAADRFQDSQATLAEIAAGLADPVDVIMHRKGVPRAQAEAILRRNLAQRERYGFAPQAPSAAAAGDGVRRPPSVQSS